MNKLSNSEMYTLRRKGEAPTATINMARGVSQYRRDVLDDEISNGLFSNGETGSSFKPALSKASPGNVVVSSRREVLTKTADFGSSTGGVASGYHGPGGTLNQTPEVYSPLWLNSNLNLPRDRGQINAWCRTFFALNPIVQNAINLHSTYPISKINIKCKDRRVNAFFENMIDEIDLMNICVQVAQEYWTIGEAFPYAEFDEHSGKWSRIIIQNPDYIDVKRSVIAGESIISLRPDDNLKHIVTSNKPSDIQQRQQLDPGIVEFVRKGQNIPLRNFYISHLARKISPYESRGTGLPVSCFKQLMLFDKLRESKFAQADNMINPLTLIKIGGDDGFRPTHEDLNVWRNVFEEAQYDKDAKIFTHDKIAIEKIGSASGIYDISGDVTQLIKEIYIGLMAPQVIMDGGGDVTYSNGGVSLDVLRQRYMTFRNMLSSWLRRKIFAPISKVNDFYERKNGEKVLIVPDVEWNHMSLFDMGDYIQNVSQLLSAEPRKVSLHTVYKSLGLEYEDEMRRIRKENVEIVIQTKELENLNKMTLNDLRSLSDDDEIKEISEAPLPGQSEGDLPGESGGDSGGFGGGFGGGSGLSESPPLSGSPLML
jgi:hypothetical protein